MLKLNNFKIISINYCLLIVFPLFFVLNSWNNYYGLISKYDLIASFGIYLALTFLIYFVFKAFFKRIYTSVMLCIFTAFYLFFYGVIHDALTINIPFLAKHSTLVVIYFVSFSLLTFTLLKKTESSIRIFLVKLNIIVCTLLIYEIGRWLYLTTTTVNTNIKPEQSKISQHFNKPDIYYLVFDEYTSSKALSKFYKFDNSGLDSFLNKSGFYIFTESKSNYMRTTFSIASMLNMNYANGLIATKTTNPKDMILGYKKIKYNTLFPLLEREGYQPINYSNFDIYKYPSSTKQTLRILNDRLIASNTFFGRVTTDLGWQIKSPLLQNILGTGISWQFFRDINQRTLSVIEKEPYRKLLKPKFIYAHFFMPHPPFLCDSAGQFNNDSLFSIDKHYSEKYIPLYLNYLKYTNTQIKKIIQNIQRCTNNSSVILLVGDHGYRVRESTLPEEHLFFNLQAVYYPDKNYNNFYPASTPVNLMRLVSNKYLNTHFPLLKDSSIKLGETW